MFVDQLNEPNTSEWKEVLKSEYQQMSREQLNYSTTYQEFLGPM